MTGERQFEAAAERGAVQRRDHRLAAGLEFAQRLQERRHDRDRVRRRCNPAQLVEIAARKEIALGGGEHDALDGFVRQQPIDQICEFDIILRAERVHRPGAVEHNERDAVA